MPDILLAGGIDVKAVLRDRCTYIRRKFWDCRFKNSNLKILKSRFAILSAYA
jgi:hypothetical protein